MKRTILVLVLFTFINFLFTIQKETKKNIEKYSGKNSENMLNWVKNLTNEVKEYADFILDFASSNDLAILTPELVSENIEYALKTKEIAYCKNIPEDIFRHFVLPIRITQEPLEDWRKQFYEELLPIVENEVNIEVAAVKVNLWVTEQMTFKQTHGRDQAPLTTINRGYGRCEESMIIYIAAARAVGIPCRPASVPYWNFTDSNHAWVEIWTPDGWKYAGEAENSLSRGWFSKTTERATLVTSEAYGYFDSPDAIKRENGTTLISSIRYYTDFDNCRILVKDQKGKPVKNAQVNLYAASFGGLFSLFNYKTDKNGEISLPLGKSSVYVIAHKDGKIGSGLLNTIESSELELTITNNHELISDVNLQFLISNNNPLPQQNIELLGKSFYDKREISNLKRDKRILSQKKGYLFAKYYDLTHDNEDSDFFRKREEFIEKCDEIAGNTEAFLKAFQPVDEDLQKCKILVEMIKRWDVKELCEIPDSLTITDVVDIYAQAREDFPLIPDSIFYEGVVGFTFKSFTPPQNGWQKEFYSRIKNLKGQSLDETVSKVVEWVDNNLKIDEDYQWSYFSGSLNPLQILNMKNTTESYRMLVLNCALKLLGVPVQYKRQLEYFNGSEYVTVEKVKNDENVIIEGKISIRINVDGKETKPEPWGNFLIGSFSDGQLAPTFFDGNHDGNTYNAVYRYSEQEEVYLESYVRNSNGDANVHLIPLLGKDEVVVNLTTPKEYIDNSSIWQTATLEAVRTLIGDSDSKKIVFISGGVAIEPESRMLDQILGKKESFDREDVKFCFISENSHNYASKIDLKDYIIIKQKVLNDEVRGVDYPVIFLFDENNEIIFSGNGYNMGLGDLLLRKLK
ncbi:MAG: transglutaminase-like domain-containing protein [Candidatus Cloacimonetes bacterium]|nr:transglutaminase-like domain-containing protein [Candidatus Cloacimonadota bacterium]